MQTLASAALSLAVMGVFFLTGAGLYLLATGRNRKQSVLMLVAAAVLLANVLILTVPL